MSWLTVNQWVCVCTRHCSNAMSKVSGPAGRWWIDKSWKHLNHTELSSAIKAAVSRSELDKSKTPSHHLQQLPQKDEAADAVGRPRGFCRWPQSAPPPASRGGRLPPLTHFIKCFWWTVFQSCNDKILGGFWSLWRVLAAVAFLCKQLLPPSPLPPPSPPLSPPPLCELSWQLLVKGVALHNPTYPSITFKCLEMPAPARNGSWRSFNFSIVPFQIFECVLLQLIPPPSDENLISDQLRELEIGCNLWYMSPPLLKKFVPAKSGLTLVSWCLIVLQLRVPKWEQIWPFLFLVAMIELNMEALS